MRDVEIAGRMLRLAISGKDAVSSGSFSIEDMTSSYKVSPDSVSSSATTV
jgi:hypothetical protein